MKNEAYLQEEIAGKYAFYYVGTLFGYFLSRMLIGGRQVQKRGFS